MVLALGHSADNALEPLLKHAGLDYRMVGDCLNPRSAEGAVYEGMMVGLEV